MTDASIGDAGGDASQSTDASDASDASLDAAVDASDAAPPNNGIDYHNGQIMGGTPVVIVIWYGASLNGDTALTIIPEFIESLSGSAYLATDKTYYDSTGEFVSGNIVYGGSYSMVGPNTLNTTDFVPLFNATIAAYPNMPVNSNSIYLVLTAHDICGAQDFESKGLWLALIREQWHQQHQVWWVGNAATQSPWIV